MHKDLLTRKNNNYILFFISTIFILIFITLTFLSSVGVYASNNKPLREPGDDWVNLEVKGKLPGKYYQIYQKLYHPDNFPLIGKLMTIFLEDKDKGYQIIPAGNNLFYIRSRKTIRPGSQVLIQSMNQNGFKLRGRLRLQKLIKFNCDVEIVVNYQVLSDQVNYITNIKYNAPGLIKGLDQTFRLITGNNFVSYKIDSFVERFHLVLAKLAGLDRKSWQQISSDQEHLNQLIFPVKLTPAEIKIVNDILE